ncbi:MAG: MBOAT family protein [Flavobacteriaceae bacterium]
MLFNSFDFAFFLAICFVIYWFVLNKHLKLQNFFILVASYVFYGWWDWRFLGLILFSTLVDFSVGKLLLKEKKNSRRKILLTTSLVTNIGLLFVFKYYNFFIESFTEAFSFFGSEIQANTLNIILPVGISFYTFQTLSYTIDIYRKKLTPNNDFISFAAFVSFFPQLVAGPIERASHLLPQFYKKRTFNYQNTTQGMRQILWGLFKKIVIADNAAEVVNLIFNNSGTFGGSTLFLGGVLFAFQIYCDFSGYSDIAIGTSKLFGFHLKKNFAFPYFSRDMAEFWRRWHISLSTWFRDYLYIPLGGSRVNASKRIRNIFIIFLVSGFWHGSNWTFVVWGALNALYFLPLLLSKKNRVNLDNVAQERFLPSLKEFFQMTVTFILAVIAWIFFRAENIHHAFQILTEICSLTLFSIPEVKPLVLLGLILVMMAIEWVYRKEDFAFSNFQLKAVKVFRWTTYLLIIFTIYWFGGEKQEFIYFQF